MTAPNTWAGSKLLAAVRLVVNAWRAMGADGDLTAGKRPTKVGIQRQYPALATAIERLAAAEPPADFHLGHATLAGLLAPGGQVSFPYLAIAFTLEGAALEPTITAFQPLKSLDDTAGFTFVAQHLSPEHQRTVLLCAVMGGA